MRFTVLKSYTVGKTVTDSLAFINSFVWVLLNIAPINALSFVFLVGRSKTTSLAVGFSIVCGLGLWNIVENLTANFLIHESSLIILGIFPWRSIDLVDDVFIAIPAGTTKFVAVPAFVKELDPTIWTLLRSFDDLNVSDPLLGPVIQNLERSLQIDLVTVQEAIWLLHFFDAHDKADVQSQELNESLPHIVR